MRVIEIIADLQVPDLEAARDFYTDYLGLSIEEFNLGWVARYTSAQTGAHLQLVTADAVAPVVPHISVKVDDVDAAYAEALDRGYEIVLPLRDEEWGVRRFFVRAPDGTVLNMSGTGSDDAPRAGVPMRAAFIPGGASGRRRVRGINLLVYGRSRDLTARRSSMAAYASAASSSGRVRSKTFPGSMTPSSVSASSRGR